MEREGGGCVWTMASMTRHTKIFEPQMGLGDKVQSFLRQANLQKANKSNK